MRTLAEITLAAAASRGLATVTPANDPFCGTLILLPWVVAALNAVERYAGARRMHRIEGRLAAIIVAGLVLLVLGRDRLGLVVTDSFLAAGLLLALGHRVARLLLGLRPLLGRRLPRRPSAAFFFVPLIAYLAIQPWSSHHRPPDGDEPYYLLMTHSLAHDGDVDLANNYQSDWQRFMDRRIEPQIGDPTGPDGEQYSRHGFLLPLVLAPAYRLAGLTGALMMMAAFSAALAWMVLRLARHYWPGEPGAALVAYGILALSPPLLLYSYQVWIEVPAALLLAFALDRLLILRRSNWTPREVALFALPLALLPLLKLRLGLLTLALITLAAWRSRAHRRALATLAGALAAGGLALLAVNTWRFGNPLGIYSWNELDLFKYSLSDFVRGGVGMFFDVAFGLFPTAPVWMLILPACGWLIARRKALAADAAIISALYLFFVAPRIEWFGGWSPPFRYPLVLLPLLTLTLVPILARRRHPWVRAALAALAAMTVVLTLIWVVKPGWTFNFADGRSHLLDAASVRLDIDLSRFFPSTIRPRPATWVWLGLALLALPAGAMIRRQTPLLGRQAAATWGIFVLFVTVPLLILANVMPTYVIHMEDPIVTRHLGKVYPPPWVLQRPRYVGGWTVPPKGWLMALVMPGRGKVKLEIHSRFLYPKGEGHLWIAAGDTRLGTVEPQREWSSQVLGPFEWPFGEPLIIGGDENLTKAVIVDRVELSWDE